jgi:hypothetical protein
MDAIRIADVFHSFEAKNHQGIIYSIYVQASSCCWEKNYHSSIFNIACDESPFPWLKFASCIVYIWMKYSQALCADILMKWSCMVLIQ